MKTRSARLTLPILACLLLALIAAPAMAQTTQPDPALAKKLLGIEQGVARVRQLPLKRPIVLDFMSREALQHQVTAQLQQQYTASDQARDERVLTAFGLIPAGTDLLKVQEAVQGEQIAGYYDPATHQMVVVRPAGEHSSFSALDELVFAHEVTHALQDQNLDLGQMMAAEPRQLDDQNLAELALIEGDATSCQVDYLLANKRLIPAVMMQINSPELSSDQLNKAPAYLRATLLFPYDQGLTFVNALKQQGGWNAVDKAYARPPMSTEQVLHPEKYMADERPAAISVPDMAETLGPGWTAVTVNDFGELGVRILLSGQSASKPEAMKAAAGWNGDKYAVWANGSQTAIVWRTAWDSAQDASEFTAAFGRYEAQRWGATAASPATGQRWISSATATTVIITNGDNVTYVLAPNRETASRLVTQLTGQAQSSGRSPVVARTMPM